MRLLAVIPQGYFGVHDVFSGALTQTVVDSDARSIVDDRGRKIITNQKRNYFADHFGRRLVTDAGAIINTER